MSFTRSRCFAEIAVVLSATVDNFKAVCKASIDCLPTRPVQLPNCTQDNTLACWFVDYHLFPRSQPLLINTVCANGNAICGFQLTLAQYESKVEFPVILHGEICGLGEKWV